MKKFLNCFVIIIISCIALSTKMMALEKEMIGLDSLKTQKSQQLKQLNSFFNNKYLMTQFVGTLYIKLENIVVYPSDSLFFPENITRLNNYKQKMDKKKIEQMYLLRNYNLRDARFLEFFKNFKKNTKNKVILFSVPWKEIINFKSYISDMKAFLDYIQLAINDIVLLKELSPSMPYYYLDEIYGNFSKDKDKGIVIVPEVIKADYLLDEKHFLYQWRVFKKENIWTTDHELINFFNKDNTK